MLGHGLNELLTYRRKNKLSVVNMGLKIWSKNKGNQVSGSDYRLLNEGLDILMPLMDDSRKINITKELYVKFTQANDH